MKFENTKVFNIEGAIRGMRNPLNSWDRSDSRYCEDQDECTTAFNCEYRCGGCYIIGQKDIELATNLIKSGSSHRKFMRQIFVSVDITAPMYWYFEFDTYKVGTTRNSSSFQHKGAIRDFTIKDFQIDNDPEAIEDLKEVITIANKYRRKYVETKNYNYFRLLRQFMPASFLYKSTITMNYENIYNMVHQRYNHQLVEWSGKNDSIEPSFITWARSLPYAKEFLFYDLEEEN